MGDAWLSIRVCACRMGDYVLSSPKIPATLYQLTDPALVLRAVVHKPVTRIHLPLSLGEPRGRPEPAVMQSCINLPD